MKVMGLSDAEKLNILSLTAAILHLGNITFHEEGNYALVSDEECKYYSFFLMISSLPSSAIKLLIIGIIWWHIDPIFVPKNC